MRNAAAGEYVKTSKAKKHPTTPTPREKGRMASAEVVLKPAYVRALGARTKMAQESGETRRRSIESRRFGRIRYTRH
jgi:hypothetical protein